MGDGISTPALLTLGWSPTSLYRGFHLHLLLLFIHPQWKVRGLHSHLRQKQTGQATFSMIKNCGLFCPTQNSSS